jgi:hypothetical protein
MTGTCKPGKQEHKSSDPLALEQFLSAFLLLMSGILLAAILLLLEHLYFKYVRHHLAKTDQPGCCALISLVSRIHRQVLKNMSAITNKSCFIFWPFTNCWGEIISVLRSNFSH